MATTAKAAVWIEEVLIEGRPAVAGLRGRDRQGICQEGFTVIVFAIVVRRLVFMAGIAGCVDGFIWIRMCG